MGDRVRSVQAFVLTIERDEPYLGPLQSGEEPNSKGYFVRKGNRTVYPTFDRSVLVRVETRDGVVGWGETYGIVAPGAVGALIGDLLAEFVIGRDPSDPSAVHDDLYDLVRVRGCAGGFYGDALAALDIALWDIAGRIRGKSVAELAGVVVHDSIPAYLSGLPKATLKERSALAFEWKERGFGDFKFAAPVADEGPEAEIRELRARLGPKVRIAVDLHWTNDAKEALRLIDSMKMYQPWFAEAPVLPEDYWGLKTVAEESVVPIALGEEWRTEHDMDRCTHGCRVSIIQPEMGHCGITNFLRMAKRAQERELQVMPHATVGTGIFLAASLKASSAIRNVVSHEFQHSVFEPSRRLIEGQMDCSGGRYLPPAGPGLGVEPSEEALSLLQPI